MRVHLPSSVSLHGACAQGVTTRAHITFLVVLYLCNKKGYVQSSLKLKITEATVVLKAIFLKL